MDLIQNILIFLDENLSYKLLFIILLSGIFITKYTKSIVMRDIYKVLIGTFLFSILFYFTDNCGSICINKYIFTYLFATSFYDLLIKNLIKRVNSIIKEE